MDFFKQPKSQAIDKEAMDAIERGDAVPTIQTALNHVEAFPYLLSEVKKLEPADRQKFIDALETAEKLMDIDDPTRFSEELTNVLSKNIGAHMSGTLIGAAILWMYAGSALNIPVVGGMATGLIVTNALASFSSFKKDAKRREGMHARVIKLKDALLK